MTAARLLTTSEVATILGVKPRQVQRIAETGGLAPAVGGGGRAMVFYESAVRRLVVKRERAAALAAEAAATPRTHCRQGHSLEDAYERADGARRCRTCHKESAVRARQKAAETVVPVPDHQP